MSPTPVTATTLSDWLDALAAFSGGDGDGVTRLVYDEAWCAAHAWLESRARDLGLVAFADGAGNLWAHAADLPPDPLAGPVVVVGSHLDTVPSGGRYDGAYGAVAGLLIAAEPRAPGALPIVACVTCEEEGSRFPHPFLGARAALGQIAAEDLDHTRDAHGTSWRDALAVAQARGRAVGPRPGSDPFPRRVRAAAMLELHIEQGPVLEREGLALGLVHTIAGYRRMRFTFTGEARHAGTTPMRMRRDALAAAAEAIVALEAAALVAGDPAVATAGFVRAEPGAYNVVPGACEVRLECRHSDPAALETLAGALAGHARAIAARRDVALAIDEVSRQDPAPMAPNFVEMAGALARELELGHRTMPSGAGHDAMIFALAGVPSMMVFVPSRDGISHSPEEFTSPEALAAGVRFGAALARRIAVSLAAPGRA